MCYHSPPSEMHFFRADNLGEPEMSQPLKIVAVLLQVTALVGLASWAAADIAHWYYYAQEQAVA